MTKRILATPYTRPVIAVLFVIAIAVSTAAQTSSFTYQGHLTDGAAAANGNYDLQFVLFDSATGGTPIGTQVVPSVAVSGGIFTVQLDFGANAFPGANRFLEISARPAGAGSFTTLSPRQQISSTPYAIRTLSAASATNATQLGGVAAGQYVQTTDARLTDARPPTAGSSNYIQNTTTQQASANFNISGNGTIGGNLNVAGALSLNIVNAQTQYNLGGSRILRSFGTDNLVVGMDAGANTSLGTQNVFVGNGAGVSNISGSDNTYIGALAGNLAMGSANTFAGVSAGFNTEGSFNSFFGRSAGFSNTIGTSNSFFGVQAGRDNCASCIAGNGSDNSFFGRSAGQSNTTGSRNSFFGKDAGFRNTTGAGNSFFGISAGDFNTTGDQNSFFGATAGASNSSGSRNSFFGVSAGSGNTTGNFNTFIGNIAGINNTTGSNNTVIGRLADLGAGNLTHATAIGAEAVVTASNRVQIGRTTIDTVAIGAFASPATSTAVCINGQGIFTSCAASSLRYKESVRSFQRGLSVIQRLRPVTFKWKEDHQPDFGLVAEEVAAVEPLLSTYNNKGEIDGVKYERLNVLLINAVKEQQAQIETLRSSHATLQSRLNSLERQLRTRTARSRRRANPR